MKPLCRILLYFSISVGVLFIPQPIPANADPLDITSYVITAVYLPNTHTISAQEIATYKNTTDNTISHVVLHLYLNAFRNANTLWMREASSGLRGFQYDPQYPGWISIESVRLADGTPLQSEALDADETLIRIELPEPVAPGGKVSLDIVFTAVLPRVFARTGWADDGDFVLAGQWFPKFGVWQQGAWNAYPFHANSEFYADFGTYAVSLTLPDTWIVGASAVAEGDANTNADGTVTHKFYAEHIIDFVWTASPHFREITRLYDGISVRALFYPAQRAMARRSLNATLQGLELYSQWYGPYGNGHYSHLTVVIVPQGAGGAGGMEYPTLFTVGSLATTSGPRCLKLTEVETLHELAHQWFQSVVATNEAEEPWLDEGFTDYSTTRAMNALYDGAVSTCGNWNMSYLALQRSSYLMNPEITMTGKAWDFGLEYSIATYAKPVVSLSTLERLVGDDNMVAFLQTYFKKFAFAHPTAEDVKRTMSEVLGEETSTWFFDQLVNGDGSIDALVAEFESDHITLERHGDLCVPTSVRYTTQPNLLQKPVTEEMSWTCDTSTLRIDGAFLTVEIDPHNSILIDQNLANNSARRTPSIKEWLGVTTRVLKSLQNFYWGGVPW